ncbi:MAG: HAD family hydrolase [Dehalococcoidia bacterium]
MPARAAARLVDAVLFDLDGTLVDSLQTIAEAMSTALHEFGYEIDVQRLVPLIGPPMDLLAHELGAPLDVAARINREYLRLYHHGYIQRTPEHPGAGALLERLAAAGIAMGVVTNKVEEGARLVLDVRGWSSRFGVVVGRDTPGAAAKPAPEAAWYALRVLGVPPERAAFVGDTEFDVRCARAAGLRHVIALAGNRDEALLRAEGATHVVRSLDEAGAMLDVEVRS